MATAFDPTVPADTSVVTHSPSAAASDLRAARGAIALVAAGAASRVVLVGLESPAATAAELGPESRAAGIPLRLDLDAHGRRALITGPRPT